MNKNQLKNKHVYIMKTKLIATSTALIAWTSILIAQVPQGFNYQAVAVNNLGDPIKSQALPVRITVQSDSLGGTVFWQELHQGVTTNEFGQFAVVVGKGARQTISTLSSFSEIEWTVTPKFIKTEVDFSGWKNMGSARFLSVPYSMVANDLGGTLKKLTVAGTTTSLEEPLFEVKNLNNQTVFAVYNEGIRAYVDNGDAKGVKGGFAIGGFGDAKAPSQEYFRITRDSARVYVNKNAKGVKGGFAIGGFDLAKGVDNFLNLTPNNYFIGHNAGLRNTTGVNNSVLGYESAFSNTEGSDNVFIGYQSGYSNALGLNNIFIGKKAGYNNIGEIQTDPYYLEYGSYNVFIGNEAGLSNVSGWTNVFVGNSAGYGNISGSDNTFVGNFSGESNTEGWGNTTLGDFSGRSNLTGDQNVFLGYYAGNKNLESSNTYIGSYSGANSESGSSNTYIGYYAGYNATGWGNVFIGNSAGSEESGNGKLYISNSGTSTPLIWGDFGLNRVGIHRVAATNTLEVEGNASKTTAGTWLANSDIRIKKDISDIEDACGLIMKLHPVKFRYTDEWKSLHPSVENKFYYNFIAQEYMEVFPESVQLSGENLNNREEGLLQMDSYNSQIISVKAIQELILENRALREDLRTMQQELNEIRALVKNK